MSTKTDYTPEEWALLARAPFMTGLIITLAAPSGITGVLEESLAVSKALIAANTSDQTDPLLASLIEDIQASKGQLAKPTEHPSLETAQAVALDSLKNAVELLHKATPEESRAFRSWLLNISFQSAEAAKEGGILGIGGVQINQAEETALAQIQAVLGLEEQ